MCLEVSATTLKVFLKIFPEKQILYFAVSKQWKQTTYAPGTMTHNNLKKLCNFWQNLIWLILLNLGEIKTGKAKLKLFNPNICPWSLKKVKKHSLRKVFSLMDFSVSVELQKFRTIQVKDGLSCGKYCCYHQMPTSRIKINSNSQIHKSFISPWWPIVANHKNR